ncbi:MAG: hypothetical protein HC831_24235, partial [Chloroflexia bacterium]|nr:hypothetical protein [Chloroflexia bacterium]
QDRLNDNKNGDIPPDAINPDYSWAPIIPENQQKVNTTLMQDILFDIYGSWGRILSVMLTSLLYGYGIIGICKSIGLIENLSFIHVLGIGFLFNHSLTQIPQQIKKLF